jgi:predicted membrane chloride channel (bestrophin family)
VIVVLSWSQCCWLCCAAAAAAAALLLLLLKVYGWPMLSVDSVQTFFGAITFALTLLLVFKTNSSYARWWEARKDVGQLVSFVHNIVRQVRQIFFQYNIKP